MRIVRAAYPAILLLAACVQTAAPPVPAPIQVASEASSVQKAVVEAVERAVPAVVNIRTVARFKRTSVGLPRRKEGQPENDYLAELLEENGGFRENSLGSGVIVSEDGLIVTNEHVIRGADEIVVCLSDRTEHRAKVVGADVLTDLALLRIDAGVKLPVAATGDSSKIRVGEWAIAVGNPFGLESTVTVGVVSATSRTEVGDDPAGDFLQTDASINPGNSGGPLLNLAGEVIGINTSVVTWGQGIGFAIPIDTVKSVEKELLKSGAVRRGWIGVGIQPLTGDLAEALSAKGEKGVIVNRVDADGPAAKGGIRPGDLLVAWDNAPLSGTNDFQRKVTSTRPGTASRVDILRGGKRAAVTLTVSEREPVAQTPGPRPSPSPAPQDPVDGLGLTVHPLPKKMLKEFGIGGGVEVGRVEPAGAAWDAGIREGDVVLAVGGLPVRSVRDYRVAIGRRAAGKPVAFFVLREGETVYLAVRAR